MALSEEQLGLMLMRTAKMPSRKLPRKQLEGSFRRALTEKLRHASVKVQTIESGGTANGIPDLYFCHKGLQGWMELKAAGTRMGSTAKLRFQPGQMEWMLDDILHGGHDFVGVRHLDGFAFVRADVVSAAGGRIPYGDDTYNGYMFVVPQLIGSALIEWMHLAVSLPLVTNKVTRGVRVSPLRGIHTREDPIEPIH